LLDFLQDASPSGRYYRRKADDVHFLPDKGTHCLNLVFLLLHGVGETEINIPFRCRGQYRERIGVPPFGFSADLGITHYDLAIHTFGNSAGAVIFLAATNERNRRYSQYQKNCCQFSHAFFPP